MKICACPGPFQYKVIAENSMKLIKVTKKPPRDPPGAAALGRPPPAGLTASVLPPTVPTVPEEKDNGGVSTPSGQTAAAVVDTGSVDSGEDCDWRGTDDGLDYTIGHPVSEGHATSDATLVPSLCPCKPKHLC